MATPSGASKTVVKSAGAVGQHSFLKEEQIAFTEHINYCLSKDDYLTSHGYLPMNEESNSLFTAIADGILLSKLINLAQADTVDERALNFPEGSKRLNPWEMSENQNIVINSAKGIGCQVVNIHAKDLIHSAEEHKEYLVLGLVWQIVKVQLLSQISIKETPQLFRLLQEGEELKDMLKLPPEDVLVRWVNYHLQKEGVARRVNNLSSDLKDGEVYLHLLHSLDADKCPKDAALAADAATRAAQAIDNAKAIEVPTFIHPGDITSGNKRLNLAFMAQIFNTRHGLDVSDSEMSAINSAFEAAGLTDEAEDDAREERVFRSWMNSLGLGGGEITIQRLADDLNDGLLLLEAIEKVAPGTVDEKKVNWDRSKLNRFKKVENCNYAVQCGKALGFSLPGIGGVDIAGGNPKLVLGFVWQLMRLQVVRMLQAVGGGEIPKDSDIINWANSTVSASGRTSHIESFKDPSLANGVFLLDLLTAIESRAVNPAIPTAGETPEDAQKNAKYVISVARKLGAQVFCTWEDIRDVKPKMIMTLVASVMSRAKELAAAKK